MKKIILALAVIISLTSTAVAAGKNSISESVLRSFNKEFSTATNVNWEEVGYGLSHATFVYNNIAVEAFFTGDGVLLATGRAIDKNSLPLLLSRNINRRFPDANIVNVVEFTYENELQYLITVDGQKSKQTLRVYSNGDFDIFRKEKK